MKIPYPKYDREQNLNCKLTNRQIKRIPILFRKGYSKSWIARKFKVSRGTVRYWLASPRKRKMISRERYTRWPMTNYYTRKQKKEMGRIRAARKRKLMGKAIDKYYNQPSISWLQRQKNKKEIKKKYNEKYFSNPENHKKRLAYLRKRYKKLKSKKA